MPRGQVILTGAAIPQILDEIFHDLRMVRIFDVDVLVFGLTWSLIAFSESTIPVVIDYDTPDAIISLPRPQQTGANYRIYNLLVRPKLQSRHDNMPCDSLLRSKGLDREHLVGYAN